MADHGSERAKTETYRDNVLPGWLDAAGCPRVTVIDLITEGQRVPRAWRLEKLYDECFRTQSLPSVAYGWKKCSAKYKGDTQRWWIARQPWAQEEWASGRKVAKVIGYDAGEVGRVGRVGRAFQNEWENARLVPMYPLYDAGLDRDDCCDLITDEGLALPPKSACKWCPNNTLAEWEEFRVDDPDGFESAVALSRNAVVQSPDVVGLMRCNPRGQRQLHVWADGGYALKPGGWSGGAADDEGGENMPCECAT